MKQLTEETYLSKHVTVDQYQRLHAFYLDGAHSYAPEDAAIELIKIAYNISEDEVDSMPIDDYRIISKNLNSFINSCPPTAPKNTIQANGKLYYIELLPDKLPMSSALALGHKKPLFTRIYKKRGVGTCLAICFTNFFLSMVPAVFSSQCFILEY